MDPSQLPGEPRLTTMADYLSARRELIAARECFFFALRAYLRPEQRPDAKALGDRLWNAPARRIDDSEWLSNPPRGYLTILENPDAGRGFRLQVVQQGYTLRVGVKLPAWHTDPQQSSFNRLAATFGDQPPMLTELATDELLVEWVFDVPLLYQSAQAMEDAIFKVSLVLESALQAFVPQAKESTQ